MYFVSSLFSVKSSTLSDQVKSSSKKWLKDIEFRQFNNIENITSSVSSELFHNFLEPGS